MSLSNNDPSHPVDSSAKAEAQQVGSVDEASNWNRLWLMLRKSIWFWVAVAILVVSIASQIAYGGWEGLKTLGGGAFFYVIFAWHAINADGDHAPKLICPHCKTKGQVWRKISEQKNGIDGTKASAAVLTGGASVVMFGLSQRNKVAALLCKNCNSKWTVTQ